MAGYKSPVIAFVYHQGRMSYGSNHLKIMELYFPYESHNLESSACGWIWKNDDDTMTAEFYSDIYTESNQDHSEFDAIYNKLKERFPELTEMSFGPDKELWKEMQGDQETFEPRPPYDPFKISFKWSKEAGLEIPFED